MTEYQRKRISEGIKKMWAEGRRAPMSQETKDKISKSRKGMTPSAETRLKISQALTGKKRKTEVQDSSDSQDSSETLQS